MRSPRRSVFVQATLASLAAVVSCSSPPPPIPPDGDSCPFVYDPPRQSVEAEQIGLEMLGSEGPLRLPDAVYERVLRDVSLIRTGWPELASEEHLGLWLANRVIVGIADGHALADIDETSACYQAVPWHLFDRWYRLDLPGDLNVARLVAIYQTFDAVYFAGVDGIVGQENFWTPVDRGAGTWQWTVDDGFYDCFDGCDCHTYYRFDVDQAGTVVLLERRQEGAPYCTF